LYRYCEEQGGGKYRGGEAGERVLIEGHAFVGMRLLKKEKGAKKMNNPTGVCDVG